MQNTFSFAGENGTITTIPGQPGTPNSLSYAATCIAWGQDHYRTFDRNIYSYQGQCEYILAKDCQANTYHIHVLNDRVCTAGTPCKRELDVYIGQTKISFRKQAGKSVVTWGGTPLTLPTTKEGNVFETIGSYTILKSSSLGFMVRWDGKESIMLAVTSDQQGNTCGLCGTFNGDKTDDFKTDSGAVVSSAASFAASWKRSALGEGKLYRNFT